MVHRFARPLNRGDTTIEGLRSTISGTTNPVKSQITIVPGIGLNGRGIKIPGWQITFQIETMTTQQFISLSQF
jgi:hypothetical protein